MENKLALQRQVGLPEDPKVALIGIVTRLTEQKGLDLIINQFEAMCQRRVQIIILGSGDHMYEDALKVQHGLIKIKYHSNVNMTLYCQIVFMQDVICS